MQGVRWGLNLQAQEGALSLQGVRWGLDLQAQEAALYVQGVRWGLDLQAQEAAFSVQGMPQQEIHLKQRLGDWLFKVQYQWQQQQFMQTNTTINQTNSQRGAKAAEAASCPLPSLPDEMWLDRDGAPRLLRGPSRMARMPMSPVCCSRTPAVLGRTIQHRFVPPTPLLQAQHKSTYPPTVVQAKLSVQCFVRYKQHGDKEERRGQGRRERAHRGA